jgi:hypothetical protein
MVRNTLRDFAKIAKRLGTPDETLTGHVPFCNREVQLLGLCVDSHKGIMLFLTLS